MLGIRGEGAFEWIVIAVSIFCSLCIRQSASRTVHHSLIYEIQGIKVRKHLNKIEIIAVITMM